jgi:hypothetical protein
MSNATFTYYIAAIAKDATCTPCDVFVRDVRALVAAGEFHEPAALKDLLRAMQERGLLRQYRPPALGPNVVKGVWEDYQRWLAGSRA